VIVYLDSNLVIYLVERSAVWGALTAARVAALRAAGDQPAISDLTRMECQVGPLISNNATLLADFFAFFSAPDVQVLPMLPAVFDRAARIRAAHRFETPDSIHLAAAVEHGCGLFLTNDARLSHFPDVPVEILT
jgi:predicted nucleic acid-binding protein